MRDSNRTEDSYSHQRNAKYERKGSNLLVDIELVPVVISERIHGNSLPCERHTCYSLIPNVFDEVVEVVDVVLDVVVKVVDVVLDVVDVVAEVVDVVPEVVDDEGVSVVAEVVLVEVVTV